jgi:hypothetical protein
LNKEGELSNVTGELFLLGYSGFDGKEIEIRNIYYER